MEDNECQCRLLGGGRGYKLRVHGLNPYTVIVRDRRPPGPLFWVSAFGPSRYIRAGSLCPLLQNKAHLLWRRPDCLSPPGRSRRGQRSSGAVQQPLSVGGAPTPSEGLGISMEGPAQRVTPAKTSAEVATRADFAVLKLHGAVGRSIERDLRWIVRSPGVQAFVEKGSFESVCNIVFESLPLCMRNRGLLRDSLERLCDLLWLRTSC